MTLLDMAKAFDSVTHPYINKLLKRMSFPLLFINYILDQIENNTAQFLNGKYIAAPNITINRGTRQGLPISPILFNLCIEPLVLEIHNKLSGIPVPPTYLLPHRAEHNTPENTIKILAFADDLITFNTSFTDILHTVKICEDFGQISGFSLNQTKTKIYCSEFCGAIIQSKPLYSAHTYVTVP
ncbi:unnamed protein product [[Candida] boidinii]|nr:unnamed protein product [[Candida] boidinii]